MNESGHILVVDRERRVGDAITAVLRRQGWSCNALADPRQAAQTLRHEVPDVLVMDLGVGAYRNLLGRRSEKPLSLPVLVAIGRPSLTTAVEALRVGAVAFLRKPVHARELAPAVKIAMGKARAIRHLTHAQHLSLVLSEWLRLLEAVLASPGPTPLPRGVLSGIGRRENSPFGSNESGEGAVPARTLSPREREALFAFASGQRPRQIARALGVTIFTARAHLKAVMRKMGVHSQTELLDRMRQPSFADESSFRGGSGYSPAGSRGGAMTGRRAVDAPRQGARSPPLA